METDFLTYIKRIAIIGVILGIGLYAYYQARPLLAGPHLEIFEPLNHSSTGTTSITILGKTERISTLTLNDREIFITEEGNFSEKLLLPLGYTIIEMTAKDRFNRSVTKTLQLVRTQ